MSARWANLLTALGLLVFLGLVSATAPRWANLLTRPLPGPGDEGRGGPEVAAESDEGHPVERQINVKLFFQAADRTGLLIEERVVVFSPDLASQIRAVVEELVRGSKVGLVSTLAPATKVREVFVSGRGVAYVDLSKEALELGGAGSEAELIAVYSVVNSLTANFPAVKRVQILVEDRPTPTLAGHVDLTRPLPPDMTLLAASSVSPAR